MTRKTTKTKAYNAPSIAFCNIRAMLFLKTLAEFMKKELEALRVLAAVPIEFDVEINHLIRANAGGDADAVVNGKVTDIKTTNTIRSALNKFMRDGGPQAEALVIDSEGNLDSFEKDSIQRCAERKGVEFIVVVDSKKGIVRYKKGRP